MHTIEEGNRPRRIAANSLVELAARLAEDRRKNPEPEESKPKGFKYSDGSVLIVQESGYRRYQPKPVSKRDRAKIKRQAKRQPLAPAVARARVGAFFA